MFGLAFIISLVTLVISVPIFLVFGLGSSLAAIAGLNLPWSVLIQVSFGALTKHVLIAVPLFIFTGMAMLKGGKKNEEKRKEESNKKQIGWGSQIRSYVLHPYKMVKDHTTTFLKKESQSILSMVLKAIGVGKKLIHHKH